MKRSWWKRVVAVKVRHNIRLILASIIVLVCTGIFLDSFPIRPIVFSEESPEQLTNSRYNINGSTDFFDLSLAHTIELTVSEENLQQMAEDFRDLGLKTWVKANAIIDGTMVETVGIRLKGNSTLKALGGESNGRFGRGGGMNLSNASFQNPSTLPLLISFDKFEKGRAYQGREELAVRPAKDGSTNLNEALALRLIANSEQVSQHFSWVNFSINDYPTATRLVLENPDKRYADSLGLGSGILYKSRSQNGFYYRGENQELYKQDFDQINRKKTYGYTPVIDLLKWLDNVTNESFDRELADWVDIQNFARYVATQDLLGNFDDMSGPGKNFLLWYDLVDENFSVLSWDMNMALGGSNFMGGGMGRGRSRRGGGFGFGGGNSLKDRFMNSDAFAYDIVLARQELMTLWNANGSAELSLMELASSVPVSDMLSQQQIDADFAAVKRELQNIR